MQPGKLLSRIAAKEPDAQTLAERVISRPALVAELIQGLGASRASVKYGCAKVLRIVSEREPAILYPRIEFFFELLGSENRLMQWQAIHVIGALAGVDTEDKIDEILETYLAPIGGPVLTTAANVIRGAGNIAAAKPQLADAIAREILKVEQAEYRTDECRDIALGHAILALGRCFDGIKRKDPVIRFVERQADNPRNATRKKAEKFLSSCGLLS